MSPNQSIVHRHATEPAGQAEFPQDPLASALGARLLRVDAQEGEVCLQFDPGATFLQGEGVIQGGAVGAMLDFATACATMAVLPAGDDCATITLTTSFMRPVRPGRLRVMAQVEKQGRSSVFARAALATEDDPQRILATASAILAVIAGRSPRPQSI